MATMKALRVVAKREGFRRAGFVFGALPRDICLDALTDQQRAAIERDPMLLVTEVEVEIEDQTEILTENGDQSKGTDPGAGAVEILVQPEDQSEVPPEGADETGGGDVADAVPSVSAATPAARRKRK